MNNCQFPYSQNQPGQIGYNPFQQIQQMFPQPQGSVYSINSAAEIGNVPTGSTGLSIALCLPESIMYIKSFQNGSPVIMAYRIAPYSKEETTSNAAEPETAPPLDVEQLLTRIGSIEETLAKLEQQWR